MSRSRQNLCALALLGALGAGGCGKSLDERTAPVQPPPAAGVASAPLPRETATPLQPDGGAAAGGDAVKTQKTRTVALAAAAPPRPRIVQAPIPFGPRRKQEMRAYALRHYDIDSYRLAHPHVIVIHYTETPDFASTWNTFAPDVPDSELHELPGTCAHFVIDRAGVIRQLVPLSIMCRHTVGLNWTAIGIEHVGYSDAQVLGNRAQMAASLALVRWLRCRYRIPVADVIGHNESLSSPYHRERVAAWRMQTHSDFNRADMRIYRSRLRALGGC